MKAKISVQIPVKNGGQEFIRCLDSLRGQDTGGMPWELILVDDGSDPPLSEEFDLGFPQNVSVKVLRIENGGNRPEARNRAWRASGASLSLLSDGDILFPPDTVRAHISAHDENRGDVIMGARINAWAEDATPWERWFDSRAMGSSPAGTFPPRYFVTGNLSIRTDLLREAGGFDPAIDRYGGEDTEFGLRLARHDAALYWDPAIKVMHLDRVTVRKHCSKMVEYGSSGLKYTLNKIPEAQGMLGSSWLDPVLSRPRSLSLVALRLLARLFVRPGFYRMVLAWMERFGRPSFLFTYLSVAGCLLGLSGRNFE